MISSIPRVRQRRINSRQPLLRKDLRPQGSTWANRIHQSSNFHQNNALSTHSTPRLNFHNNVCRSSVSFRRFDHPTQQTQPRPFKQMTDRHFCGRVPTPQSHKQNFRENETDENDPAASFVDENKVKKRYGLVVAYVGTNYNGSQKQSTEDPERPTIEGQLEIALNKCGYIHPLNFDNLSKIGFNRASRTDKGVHSLGNIFSCKLEVEKELVQENKDISEFINAHLPPDIRVLLGRRVSKGFSSRGECLSRLYGYLLPLSAIGTNDKAIVRFQNSWKAYEGLHFFFNFTTRLRVHHRYPSRYFPTLGIDHVNLEDLTHTQSESDVVREENLESEDFQLWLDKLKTLSPIELRRLEIDHFHFSPQIQRQMLNVECSDPVEIGGKPFLKLSIHGNSFMLHQIRKMIGLSIGISKEQFPEEYQHWALSSPFKLRTPIAPGSYLFHTNSFFREKRIPSPTDMTQHFGLQDQSVIELRTKFRDEVLLPFLANLDHEKIWSEFPEDVERSVPKDLEALKIAVSEWIPRLKEKEFLVAEYKKNFQERRENKANENQ